MQTPIALAPLLAGFWFLQACQFSPYGAEQQKTSAFAAESARNQIVARNQLFMDAFRKRDSTALANFYTEDSWLMAPNSEVIRKTQNAAMWGMVFRMGLNELVLETQDIEGTEQQLAETGLYTMYGGNRQVVDQGKYLVVWVQRNDQWMMYRDIWNTSIPQPKPK